MRILAIGMLYPPFFRGGYELICEGVMRLASAEGHDVRVLVSDFRPDSPQPVEEPQVYRTLRPYVRSQGESAPRMSLMDRFRLERYNLRELSCHLMTFEPNVVSWWQMGGLSLSLIEQVRRLSLPSVFAVLDDWLVYGPRIDAWLRLGHRFGAGARVLASVAGVPNQIDLTAGRFLFISDHLRRATAAAGIAPRDTDTVPAGIHERFLAATPAHDWNWRLLYVGRVDPTKGVDVAVRALSHLPEAATLDVVGEGNANFVRSLRCQARQAGVADRVAFRGPVPVEDLPRAYAESDVVVFPPRWEEPWGLVPLEAMGMNRPVVASATGGSAEYLRDGLNALLFPRESAEGLANAVLRLARDPSLRNDLRRAGVRTAREHTAAAFERRVVDELVQAAEFRDTS